MTWRAIEPPISLHISLRISLGSLHRTPKRTVPRSERAPHKSPHKYQPRRPEYRSLAQVPFTLILLAKVLASKGVLGAVLSMTNVYDSALQLLLRYDLQKSAGAASANIEVSLRELLCTMAFWNHLSGAIAQPWSE